MATVSEAWGVVPDATTAVSINPGGGAVCFKGSYRTSRLHSFGAYETQGNGAGLVWTEAGGSYSLQGERELILGDVDGYQLLLESGNPYTVGTCHRVQFRQRLGDGSMSDVAEIRHLAQGSAGAESSSILFYTKSAGAAIAEAFRVDPSGVQIGSGTNLRSVASGALSHAGATISAGASLNIDVTVTGAAVGDAAQVSPPAAIASGLTIDWVPAHLYRRERVPQTLTPSSDQ